MFDDLSDLREPLFAARLLREQIIVTPVPRAARERLSTAILARNGDGRGGAAALSAACARPVAGRVGRDELAAAAGVPARALRRGIGQPFHGRAAPAAAGVADLLDELLDTLNAPAAVESWPGPVRAAAFHFFLRLVQPWDADAAAPLAEAWVLAADGFDGRAMLLPPAEPADPGTGKPDPETFVRDRVHALVESLAATEELLRAECSRTVLREDCAERGSGLNARQRALVRWLSGPESRPIAFADYVRIHAGRRAPSLRSLQRDWKGLREGGWIEESDRGFELRSERAAWGPWASPGGGALFTKG